MFKVLLFAKNDFYIFQKILGVQISHNGRCVREMKVKESCPDKCDPITDKNATAVICGSDGNAYP